MRSLSALALALTLTWTPSLRADLPAAADDVDVSRALPGSLHVGALVDVRGFLETFPALAAEGFLAEQLDELAARGIPDPREEIGHLGIGSDLGKPNGVREGVALGTSDVPVVPLIRALAAEQGIDLDETAYRGVTMVTGTYDQRTSRFADPVEGAILVAYDNHSGYSAASRSVDTLQGQHASFWDEHGVTLGPEQFLVLRMTLSSATRRELEGTDLEELGHMRGASGVLSGDLEEARLVVRAKATSTFKAMIALGLLRDKLEQIASETEDPAAKRLLLEHTALSRSGATLIIDADAPYGDFVAGLLALQELLRG